MTSFHETEAGRFTQYAKRYLDAALELDCKRVKVGRVYDLPILALTGHALELLIKATCQINSNDYPWGHDIVDVWNEPRVEPLRAHVLHNAICVYGEARESGLYSDNFDDDPMELIQRYVSHLAQLHGDKTYLLRYPTREDGSEPTQIPRTSFLVRTLHRTAENMCNQPMAFELSNFLGPGRA